MRNTMRRTVWAAGLVFLVLGALAAPTASAQSTETLEVLESGETLIVNTLITDGGNLKVITETLVAVDGCSEKVTITTETLVTDTIPVVPTQEYESRSESLAPVVRPTLTTTVTEEERERDCDEPILEGDEVLGEVILAVTGSDIDTPIAAGAVLIATGGLLVAASKRRRSSQAELAG